MALEKPFHRIYRPVKGGPNSGYSSVAYIRDKSYSINPLNYLRAYAIIQADLETIFEYVEPSPETLSTFSYRIHELLMRTCIEIEANFKAILSENTYTPRADRYGSAILNMGVYRKINITHHLSSYKLVLPVYNGPIRIITPFESWISGHSPDWYVAYNDSKHDRHEKFKKANMENLISAVAGLVTVLSSQFHKEDFSAGADMLSAGEGTYHDMSSAIGSLFRIQFPDDWIESEMYEFDWTTLTNQDEKFSRFNYDDVV